IILVPGAISSAAKSPSPAMRDGPTRTRGGTASSLFGTTCRLFPSFFRTARPLLAAFRRSLWARCRPGRDGCKWCFLCRDSVIMPDFQEKSVTSLQCCPQHSSSLLRESREDFPKYTVRHGTRQV